MAKNITFRTQLVGGVTEFCQGTKLPLINNPLHLVELIVLLAHYHEEGVSLCPRVYLTDKMDALVSMLPEGDRLMLGKAPASDEGIRIALKKSAPLALGGWNVYIWGVDGQIEFGVFKGSENPISVLIDDVLLTPSEEVIVVKAFQIADDCVEIRANNREYHYVFLNHRKEDSAPPLEHFDELIAGIVGDVDADLREPVTSFLTRAMSAALRQAHGCIIAVINADVVPEFLSGDGTILGTPIDFPQLVMETKRGTLSSLQLQSKALLLNGMLNSDGIVVFDNRGRLIGYNCFVKVKQDERRINGGARKRAFFSLTDEIGKGVAAAYMQSQDGWTEFRK